MTRRVLVICVVAGCGDPSGAIQIASSTPPYGPLVGGTRITLAGAGFTSSSEPDRVLVAGREAPLAAAIDDATLEVVIPPGEQSGDAEIVVLSGNRNGRAVGIFHYSTPPTITSVAPADVVVSAVDTRVTVTGSGFLDEAAGDVNVVIDGQLASDVEVTSDSSLSFTAPSGRPLVRPDLELVDGRGRAIKSRAFRYTPSTNRGLLLFPPFGSAFAVFFDPSDNSSVAIPWVVAPAVRFTAVVRDTNGDYWGFDRGRRFGRIDMKAQRLEAPIQTQGWFPTIAGVGGDYFALERGSLRFGRLDPATGFFATIGSTGIPCCGSYGLAFDGTTFYFTSGQGALAKINTIDATTGDVGTPVSITAGPAFHVEEMRFFDGTLYAASRDGTLVTIDPTSGATTVLPVSMGRFNAMELFEP